MTENINLQKYVNLLVETLPITVKSDSEHQKYKIIVTNFMLKGEEKLSPEETEILRLLCVLIADYEKKAFPVESLAPHILLQTILEDNFMKNKDLLPIFKTESAISEILNGKRPISREKAKDLAELFKVSYKVFL